ncbi:hypothetical protein GCM10010112_55760 [Actinoplanes lobatus]|uniref:Uncharacterized protein n=1 Tax=Actinoplanes lobatus TaxID=113568 RepID=A0A7W7HEU2_9ACTN|nr:hypothetical protein [Actinoplanes lobatus]GGN80335.1 hypothetical protein GCM10010112_55760 [Actinoplanes lobatus]GIE45236.1 hypothetical protein Alo02nite_81340 [Actinoplanes lobatus]
MGYPPRDYRPVVARYPHRRLPIGSALPDRVQRPAKPHGLSAPDGEVAEKPDSDSKVNHPWAGTAGNDTR